MINKTASDHQELLLKQISKSAKKLLVGICLSACVSAQEDVFIETGKFASALVCSRHYVMRVSSVNSPPEL